MMMVMMMMENVVYIFLWVLIDWVLIDWVSLGNFFKKINCMREREREKERNPRCFIRVY